MKNCKLSTCNKEFEPSTAAQAFCSGKCQRRHRYERSKNMSGLPETDQPELFQAPKVKTAPEPKKETKVSGSDMSLGALLHDLPPFARYMINEKDRAWKEEKELREKAETELKKITKELDDIKMENKLSGLQAENSKPDFLEGLMNNQFMGPVIAEFAKKCVDAIPVGGGVLPAAAMGEVTEVPENLRTQAAQIVDWYAKQDPEVQQLFYKMVSDMAGKESGENKMRLRFINNMQRYGNNNEAAA